MMMMTMMMLLVGGGGSSGDVDLSDAGADPRLGSSDQRGNQRSDQHRPDTRGYPS